MRGTIRKQDVRRLYHQIRKRSNSKIQYQNSCMGSKIFKPPSYSQIRYALQNVRPITIGFLTKAWNHLDRFRTWIARKMYNSLPKPFKKIVKKMERIERKMEKILFCMEPRLKRRYGQLIYPEGLKVKELKENKINFFKDLMEFIENGNAEDEKVEYIEDCFEDMDRPKFGYMVKIMLKENEPCNMNTENPNQNPCILQSNQTSNRLAPGDLNHYAQSRQTGQEFRAAAPPDCRIFVC